MLALRTLEFDRIVDAVTALALTPLGSAALSALEPSTDPKVVVAAQEATTETTRFLERHPLFPLRAGESLPDALASLAITGRPLEPLQLRLLADFVDSVDQAGVSVRRAGADFPILGKLVAHLASFKDEVAAVRHAIDPGGDVLDHASPELKRIRNELRQKRQKLRGTLEQFTRGSSAKYLQEEIVTERNGRFVLMVKAFFHLSANFNYPLMVVLSVLMGPSMVIRYNMGWYEMMLIDIPLFLAATASVANFYMVCQRELYPQTWTERLKYLPFLMSIGIGPAVNNTRAVFEALFHKPSEFVRTPKYAVEANGDEWSQKKYRQSVAVQPLIELGLGLYFTATLFYALANGIYGTVPFLMLFQVGFLYTGMLSLLQQYGGDSAVEVVQGKEA